MPVFELDEDERFPDYNLIPAPEGISAGKHGFRIYIELSDAEYASYKDALDNYEAWVRRINNEAQTLRSKRIVPK